MHGLLLLGLSHATAPLEVREKLAFISRGRSEALAAMKERFPHSETVILSTCNRVELYIARDPAGAPTAEQAVAFLAEFHGVPAEAFEAHLYRRTDRQVVDHLFRVAASLDSMVVGESQILGQVRSAYDLSVQVGSAGGMLNPLFQKALFAGKQVMQQTALGQGRLSIASVAVDYAKRIFDHFHDKTILSVGAGKMAGLVLKHLHDLHPKQLLVSNRDPVKAAALAGRFEAQPAPFERLEEHLVLADIVLTSTGSAHPIITRGQFETLLKKRRYRPIFLIDIALPRDVEASVGDLENVYLYNIDDLQHAVSQTMSQRNESIASAQNVVDRAVEEFLQWNRARAHGPLIDSLFTRYHQVAADELERTLKKLPNITPQEREHLRELTRRLVNKLLHDPVRALRHAGRAHVDEAAYEHALKELFSLKDPPEREPDE
jgi:glutamyl-tRNA reductase